MPIDPTPGRLPGRSGVFIFLAAVVAVSACDALGGGATVQLDGGEVRLPAGAEVHEVRIAGAGGTDSVAPARIEAGPRDAVRFVAGDHRTHALAFIADSLPAGAVAFLESSSQLRGPPLVSEGTAWIVSLDGAPSGRYPFYCRSHGARGVVTVGSDR